MIGCRKALRRDKTKKKNTWVSNLGVDQKSLEGGGIEVEGKEKVVKEEGKVMVEAVLGSDGVEDGRVKQKKKGIG